MTNTNPIKKFHGLEIAMDNIRMEEQLLPEGFDSSQLPFNNLEYFKQYGFKVSAAFPYIYKQYNGIISDKWIPASLYFYYINPYLVNMNLSMAYVDKNMYSIHFPNIKQPTTIFHNMNGHFFDSGMKEHTPEEVLNRLLSYKKFIIKPAIESGRGRDVSLVNVSSLSEESLKDILNKYIANYIIQEVIIQHSEMDRLNNTSINTCRLYTYRRVDNGEYILLGAAVRFGGQGAFRDNACTGGGFCKIHDDGSVCDNVFRYRRFGHLSLSQIKGLTNFKIPNYDKVLDRCISMHKTVPYMDLIGWDIAIGEDGDPVLIELNQYPDCELIQIFNGPMFGQHTDSLLEKISKYKTEAVTVYKRSFENESKGHAYNFEVGKQFSI